MTTIPKIQRGEINYTKAIIKGEKDKDGNVKDYDEMLEYYAEKAAFLKHPKIRDYVEVNFKGDITINNLRPGNYNEIIMIPYYTSLQDNTEHLKTQRSYSIKKALYSPIRLSGWTTTDRLSYSIYLNIYTKQNHSSKIFQALQHQSKRYFSTRKTVLKSRTICQKRLNELLNGERSRYWESNTLFKNRKREWRQSAESASPMNAMIRGAPTYDVANVVQVTKQTNVRNPKKAKNKNYMSIVITLVIHGPNAVFKNTNISKQKFGQVIADTLHSNKYRYFVKYCDAHINGIICKQYTNRNKKSREKQHDYKWEKRIILNDTMIRSILRNCKHFRILSTRKKRRQTWYNPRAEEAKDKIYRIPPPGNGNQKQANITDFFSRIRLEDDVNVDNTTQQYSQNAQPQQSQNDSNGPVKLRILQWNACSMNEEKRKQLEYLACKNTIDIICVSEIGRYRKISNFTNCVKSDTYTQSAIFWRNGLSAENIPNALNKKHQRILTQCITIADQALLIHTYHQTLPGEQDAHTGKT